MRTLMLLAAMLVAPLALAAGPKPRLIEAELTRAEVDPVLARGPQRFIAGLRVEPHLDGGRFVGFRIVGFTPDGALTNNRSIQPGDVVLRVNEEPVERPEQFMRAWEVVQRADKLEVLVLRGQEKLLYRWKLVRPEAE